MKQIKKILLIFLLVTLTMSCLATTAFAADGENGLYVSVTSDKESYSENEDIKIEISVKNTNNFALSNVSIESLLPDGLKIKSGEAIKQISTVSPNEIVKISSVAILDVAEKEMSSNTNITPPLNLSTSENTTVENATNVKTGDPYNIVIVLFIVLISGAALLFTIKYRNKAKKALSLLLCVGLISGIFSAYNVFAENGTIRESITASKGIVVENKDYLITAKVSYDTKQIEGPDDDNTYTRGEWVKLLSEKLSISNMTMHENFNYFYGDSINSDYGIIVETAKIHGLLPTPDSEGYDDPNQDIPLFEAEKLVTREFAAYTVAKAMGFEGEYMLECDDLSSIKYPTEVGIVVKQEFITLVNNSFLPNKYINEKTKNKIFERIDYFNDSLKVESSEQKDNIDLKDDVIKISNITYTATKSQGEVFIVTLPKNEETSKISEGSKFILPKNENFVAGISLKATTISQQGESLVVTCSVPKIEEIVNDFDFAGFGNADISNMQVADGVTAEYDPNGSVGEDETRRKSRISVGGSMAFPGKIKYSLLNKDMGNGVKASGDFEFSIPDITVRASGSMFEGLSLEELTASVTSKFDVKGEVSYSFGVADGGYDETTGELQFAKGKTELGKIPIILGATGLSLDFVIFVNVDINGKAEISYSITNTSGFQYKNGDFRVIKDYKSEFKSIEINAKAQVGLGLSIRISLFSIFDLAGIDGHVGIGAIGKFIHRTNVEPNMYCGDGLIYLYATLDITDDTLLIDILEEFSSIKTSWKIFDDKNSPLKLNIHLENGKKVSECSYGKGHIMGLIKSANTGNPIIGSKINIYSATTNAFIKTVFNQAANTSISGVQLNKGEFLAENLPVGNYRLEIIATGYQAYNINIDVVNNQRVVCEAALMLLRENINGEGTASGLITNSLTGEQLTGVNYIVRKGWNNTNSEIIKQETTTSTSYLVQLPAGNYSIEFSKDGFVNSIANIVIQSNIETEKHIAITPKSGIQIDKNSFRAVLTWGENPRDLDSHLYGKNADNSILFHTSFRGKTYYEANKLIANLDLDDVTSYGPETTTVYSVSESSKYSFYVHDYTNKYTDNSTELSMSGAQVKLYSGEVVVATFNIPQNREGTKWHVFDYNAATNEVIVSNVLSYSSEG